MNARTVTRLCKELFDDRVASWTNHAGNITAEGNLSRELRERISRCSNTVFVSPFRAKLTPAQWTRVFDAVATCTVDSAVTTTHDL